MSTQPTPADVDRFVAAMKRTDVVAGHLAGRRMAERVFREVAKASSAHAACLNDRQLATYLLEHGWTYSDVTKRES